jgi:hypothetical protein
MLSFGLAGDPSPDDSGIVVRRGNGVRLSSYLSSLFRRRGALVTPPAARLAVIK